MERDKINIRVSNLHAINKSSGFSKLPLPLQINQNVQAKVISSNNHDLQLMINGKIFTAQANVSLQTGNSYSLKVVSLFPHLSFVYSDVSARAVSTPPSFHVTHSNKTNEIPLTSPISVNKSASVPLIDIINFTRFDLLQNFSVDTRNLLTSLKNQILKAENINNPNLLKFALTNSGIFLDSKLARPTTGTISYLPFINTDLKKILLQLQTGLNADINPLKPLIARNNIITYGLSQYVQDESFIQKLTIDLNQKVEEALLQINNNQKKIVEESNKQGYLWVFKLLLDFDSTPKMVPFYIRHEKQSKNSKREDSLWKAEFFLDLDSLGMVHVTLSILNGDISIQFKCETNTTILILESKHHILQSYLRTYNLKLIAVNSILDDKEHSTPTLDSKPTFLPEIEQKMSFSERITKIKSLAKILETKARQGKIAEMTSFSMSKSYQTIPLVHEIPEPLFAAISSLFAYLLELDQQGESG